MEKGRVCWRSWETSALPGGKRTVSGPAPGTDAAETMTVLEQSSQGEVSIYSISGQQHGVKMRPSRSQLRIYKLNKRTSY